MRTLIATAFAISFVSYSCAAFAADTGPANCIGPAKSFSMSSGDWNGWGVDITNTRFQPQPGLAAADVPKLKLKWAFGFPGLGDSRNQAQPVLVGKHVFVGSFSGKVYSLDASSGCIYWTYDAGAFVRGAISVQRTAYAGRAQWMAFFGDGKGFAHAIDAETGELVWKVQVDDFPEARITGTPAYYNGRLYVPVASGEELVSARPKYECCKFRGSLAALDARTGRQIWKTFTIPDPAKAYKVNSEGTQLYGPAGAGIWSSPTIDEKRKRVYVGTGNSFSGIEMPTSDAILAFDLESGSLLWSSQAMPGDNWIPGCPTVASCPDNPGQDFDFGSSVMLRSIGGGKQIIVAPQKSGVIFGLDPDERGKVLWKTRVGAGGAQFGGFVWGAASEGRVVYAGLGENAQGTSGGPGLYVLNIATGETILAPALATSAGGPPSLAPAALTAIPGVLFSGSLNGHLRAYSTKTGEIIWDFDALHDFDTINKIAAKGGSFNGGGVVVAHGMVVVNSGFGFGNGPTKPGNVLLNFSVDGK